MSSDAERLSNLLRARGLRVTPQRRAVWNAFGKGRGGHLTADDVLRSAREDVPEISRATVYNALAEMVGAGVLATIEGSGSQLYDANVEPHDHFRCRSCGELYDVHATGVEKVQVVERDFVVDRTRLLLEGTCPSCASARRRASENL
jgi:Fe2+ or Zn2+ uptake regulation protein